MPWGLIFSRLLTILKNLLKFLPTIYTLGRVECFVYSVNVARARPLVAPTKSETWPEVVEQRVALDCWTSLRLTIIVMSNVYVYSVLATFGSELAVRIARYKEGNVKERRKDTR